MMTAPNSPSFEYGVFQALFSFNENFLIQIQIPPGDIREGEIPDPIPNSEVKTFIADGTIRKSMGE